LISLGESRCPSCGWDFRMHILLGLRRSQELTGPSSRRFKLGWWIATSGRFGVLVSLWLASVGLEGARQTTTPLPQLVLGGGLALALGSTVIIAIGHGVGCSALIGTNTKRVLGVARQGLRSYFE